MNLVILKPRRTVRRSRRAHTWSLILVAILVGPLLGAPPAGTSKQRETEGRSEAAWSKNSTDELIAALVSPNKPPTWREHESTWLDDEGLGDPIYPPGYDHAAQTRVLKAVDTLVDRGTAAFRS